MDTCSHFDQIRNVEPHANGCEDCLKIGDTWSICGCASPAGTSDAATNLKNKHATRHFKSSHHPLIQSFEPGEAWGWCFVDEAFFDSIPNPSRREFWSASVHLLPPATFERDRNR